MRRPLILPLLALLLLPRPHLGAQGAVDAPPPRFKLDLGAGGAAGGGGGERDIRSALAFSGVLAVPVSTTPVGRVVAAANANAHLTLDFGTSCVLRPPATDCVPQYPHFSVLGALAGIDFARTGRGSGFRLLVGPAAMRNESTRRPHVEKSTTFALQARGDAAYRVSSHFGFVLWTHLVTSSRGPTADTPTRERYNLVQAGVGVRIQ